MEGGREGQFPNKNTWKISGFPSGNEFTCNAGDEGSIPWAGRSFGEGTGNPL